MGADERVFQKLKLVDYNKIHIQWISPSKNESLEAYTLRLIQNITVDKPILVGLSFGGIVAIEAAKRIQVSKLILISSVKTTNEIPFYIKWLNTFQLHKLIPPYFIRRTNFFTNWIFGVNSREEKDLLKQIMGDTDPSFFRWAIGEIAKWKNNSFPSNTIHIHGVSDRIFPLKYINANHIIENGGHFMIYDKAGEISNLINSSI